MTNRDNFNPPAPCGAGRPFFDDCDVWDEFQSARPVRGGTTITGSIGVNRRNFNPPAPCGAGHVCAICHSCVDRISIRPPRAGRDP